MIFETTISKKDWLKKEYIKHMKELNDFWELEWKHNQPRVFLMENKKTIDLFRRKETKKWQVAAIYKTDIFLLSPENYEKDSIFKYSQKEYSALLKHELCHCFFQIISERKNKVIWLDEGLAIYLSEMTDFKYKKPIKLKHFLDSFHEHKEKVYQESGFAVKALVETQGKEKIIELVKKLKRAKLKKSFQDLFNEIYGFELNYKNINNLLK